MLYNNRMAISGLVATILLLFFAIGSFVMIQNWLEEYESDLGVDISVKDFDNNIEILKIDGTKIYIRNDYRNDLRIDTIKVADTDCDVNNVVIDTGIAIVDIGDCTYGYEGLIPRDVVLLTSDGIVQEYNVIENPLDSLFVVALDPSPCDFSAGYVRLLGLSAADNAHVDIDGTYTYNVCLRHLNHTLGTSSVGNFVNFLYLTSPSNSAVWTDKGSIYQAPSNWYNVSLSVDSGTILFAINSSDMSADGYDCILRIEQDDVYGAHAGPCESSSLPDRLWFKIED